MPHDISIAISRCLLSVLKEALNNVVRHSSVRHISVVLRGTADSIDLSVCDAGPGFDLDAALREQGLGLTRMKEHVKLVGGDLQIDSHELHGTTVLAHVPIRR